MITEDKINQFVKENLLLVRIILIIIVLIVLDRWIFRTRYTDMNFLVLEHLETTASASLPPPPASDTQPPVPSLGATVKITAPPVPVTPPDVSSITPSSKDATAVKETSESIIIAIAKKIPLWMSEDKISIPMIILGIYIVFMTFSYSFVTTVGILSALSGLVLFYINKNMVNTTRVYI
jgi:hypothetical protein